jgi:hypothetical protein
MSNHTIEISSKGKWIQVPALPVDGETLVVKGRWLKVASIHDEAWMETEIKDPEACMKLLRMRGADGLGADLFTFTQKPSVTTPKYGYPVEYDSIAAICFASFKEWWECLPQETRKNVRRSQKRGVIVNVKSFDDDLLRGIKDVNDDSPTRQGERNYYYGRSLEQLRKDYSAFIDRSDFICATLGEEMVGFVKVVYRGDVASILNITVKPSHSDKRPANALIAKAVELCDAKGMRCLTYGLYNYGNKQDSPLREFKTRNGFEEVLTPRFYVPLTKWGQWCLKLKLHRGLLGVLPHTTITRLLSARTKLQRFRQHFNEPV